MSINVNEIRKLSVAELRAKLVESGKYSEQEAKDIKYKDNLVEAYIKMEHDLLSDLDNILDDGEEDVEPYQVPDDMVSHDLHSPEWQDYLFSLLREDELANGYPKLVGLRRLVEDIVGPILVSNVLELNFIPNSATGRAWARYQVIVATEYGNKEVVAAASSWSGNTDKEFSVFAEAMAESRAESRALRKLLNFAKVSAEELTSKDTSLVALEYGDTSGDEITPAQKKGIQSSCDRLGIHLDRFINSGEGSYDSLDSVPLEKARLMMKRLNDFRSNPELIPDSIKKESNQ